MMKRIAVFLICLALMITSFIPQISSDDSVRGTTFYVGGTGAGNYTTIQSAIDDANSGDTVYVYNGEYYENVIVDKSIELIGESRDNTKIDANGDGDVIQILSDSVSISGFKITDSGYDFNDAGIDVIYGVNYITIVGNIIYDNENNGIYLSHSAGNIISQNLIEFNLMNGIQLVYSSNNIISNNNIKNQVYHGIELNGAKHNIINNNEISYNNAHGINIQSPSENNSIFHNNFIENNAYDSNQNSWDNGYPSGGNYWDNYYGLDENGDGIGDTPYNISGGSNQDLYPLMYPYEYYDKSTVYVDDDYDYITTGWNVTRFNVIQDGIDAVAENGTVYVFNGTYYENVVADKSIDLIGENKYSTTIDGGGIGDVVCLNADNVKIISFCVRDGKDNSGYAGIKILSDYNTISNSYFINNRHGIFCDDASNNTINENIFNSNIERGMTIKYSSCNNNILNNIITNHSGTGLVIDYYSCNCSVYSNCLIDNNRGISIDDWSDDNIIFNNSINGNTIDGILLSDYCCDNQIITNSIINNSYGVNVISSSYDNEIYHNNFENNDFNAYDECNNIWDDNYPSGGNYWDDYTGTDADDDGIGDTPYYIPGGSNQDNYPFGPYHPIADYIYSPTNPTRLDIIQFTDTSFDPDGTIVNWSWEFSDGYGSLLQNPTHQYTDLGTYQVNLTVWDNENRYNITQQSITIVNCQPIADFEYLPLDPLTNEQIDFTDISTDLDGYIDSWYWDFGDGYISTLQNPSHTYTQDGIYSVTLEVTDNDGGVDTVAKVIPVDFQMMAISNVLSGWNFISAPYNYTQDTHEFFFKYGEYYYNWTQATTSINPTDNLLINQFMFGWNRNLQTYLFERNLEPGYGCWMYAYQPCELWNQYDDIPEDEYITTLQPGWNSISIPFNQSIDKIDVLVDDIDWNTAVANLWVNNFVFYWNRGGQYYDFANTFNPGEAYWVYAYQPCMLKQQVF